MDRNETNSLNSIIYNARENNLLGPLDDIIARNSIVDLLGIDYVEGLKNSKEDDIEALEILYKKNDLNLSFEKFVSRIMGELTPRNSEVIRKFNEVFKEEGSQKAIDWYYELCQNTKYIRMDQVAKNRKWVYNSKYGDIDITINMSKPEKDPRDIAKAKDERSEKYPRCVICKENIGYKGRPGYAERSNHRIIPLELNKEIWYLQFSPYVYYNKHLIVLSDDHIPMYIDDNILERLLDFVDIYPDLFLGSNAPLPIVGGSILNHNHFQGGDYEFPIEKSKVYKLIERDDFKLEILDWPVTTLRIRSKDREKLKTIGYKLMCKWDDYENQDLDIVPYTKKGKHSTTTLIIRKKDDEYLLYMSLRNNRTSEEYPKGIFHAHEEYHHIKKENIGLIEIMGMAILPSRLNVDLDREKKEEIGEVFVNILENCGVFKRKDYKSLEYEVNKWLS